MRQIHNGNKKYDVPNAYRLTGHLGRRIFLRAYQEEPRQEPAVYSDFGVTLKSARIGISEKDSVSTCSTVAAAAASFAAPVFVKDV